MLKCRIMDWQEANEMAEDLYEKIKSKRYKPDVIIAVARGGFHPARALSDFLKVKTMETVNVDHWGVSATESGKAEINSKIGLDITGKKILIVDDIADTGQSMKVMVEYVEQLNPGEIKTATLHIRKGSRFTPDFYVEELYNKDWIVYPWMLHEDLSQFIYEIISDWKDLNEIGEELEEKRGIKGRREGIMSILEDLEYWKEIEKKRINGKLHWRRADR